MPWMASCSAVKRGLSRREALPAADSRIAFDRFHVAQYMGKAVDQLHRQEHRCSELRQSSLKTARAWAIKGLASCLWDYRSRTWAKKGWKRLINRMARSRLKPMQTTSKTLRNHLWGILNAVIFKVDNSHAESINSRIKTLKSRARGFRNRERFRNTMYFHLGGLQLYPEGISA